MLYCWERGLCEYGLIKYVKSKQALRFLLRQKDNYGTSFFPVVKSYVGYIFKNYSQKQPEK